MLLADLHMYSMVQFFITSISGFYFKTFQCQQEILCIESKGSFLKIKFSVVDTLILVRGKIYFIFFLFRSFINIMKKKII